jgi:hypothetical protein
MADEHKSSTKGSGEGQPAARTRQSRFSARQAVGEVDGQVATTLEQVIRLGTSRMQEVTNLQFSTVVAVEPSDDGWHLQVELVEKESIPHGMDVLGLYDVWFDRNGSLVRFARQGVRRRADVSADM